MRQKGLRSTVLPVETLTAVEKQLCFPPQNKTEEMKRNEMRVTKILTRKLNNTYTTLLSFYNSVQFETSYNLVKQRVYANVLSKAEGMC
jgi:hypothetical protein